MNAADSGQWTVDCPRDSLQPTLSSRLWEIQILTKPSVSLTSWPAACFSWCAARWGLRADGSGTRSRLWWETPSHRCNRSPGPGGRLHLRVGQSVGGGCQPV